MRSGRRRPTAQGGTRTHPPRGLLTRRRCQGSMQRLSCLHSAASSTCCASACQCWGWWHWGRRPAARGSAAPAERLPMVLGHHHPPIVTASDGQHVTAWPLQRLKCRSTLQRRCSWGAAPLACQSVALLHLRRGREKAAVSRETGGAAEMCALLAPAMQGPPWCWRPV